jgi:hypothetical protein
MDTAGRMRGAQRDCWSLADVGTGSVRIADGRYLTGMALSSAWCEGARVNPQPILATGWIGTAPTDLRMALGADASACSRVELASWRAARLVSHPILARRCSARRRPRGARCAATRQARCSI